MRQYLIKKGNHYCSMSIFEKLGAIGWKIKKHTVKFRFHPDCYWAPERNNDDSDLNKLTGISYGMNVHSNSVRLTWRPDFNNPGTIEIFGYTYDEAAVAPKFSSLKITSVQVGQLVDACIVSDGNHYDFTVNKVTASMPNTNTDPNLCLRLYPYFGGNNTAPQDMTIDIDYL
ncbi:MAG: hypothetical protein WCK09_07995 [Bacteroidota bacterium]